MDEMNNLIDAFALSIEKPDPSMPNPGMNDIKIGFTILNPSHYYFHDPSNKLD